MEIIEQVKDETKSADETNAPAQSDTAAEDGGPDDANNLVVEDDSGSGRQLVPVGARFVLAALRVFGI